MGIKLDYGSIQMNMTDGGTDNIVIANITDEGHTVEGSPFVLILGGEAQQVDTRKTKEGYLLHDTDMVCSITLMEAFLEEFDYKIVLEGSLYENKGVNGPTPFSFTLEFTRKQSLVCECTYPLEVGGSNYIIEPDHNNSCLKYTIWEDPETADEENKETDSIGRRKKLDKFSGDMTTTLNTGGKAMTGTIKGLLSNKGHKDSMYMKLELTYPYQAASMEDSGS